MFMKNRGSCSGLVFGVIAGLAALVGVYGCTTRPAININTATPIITVTASATGTVTLTPTGSVQARDTAAEGAMETYRALFSVNTPLPTPTCCPPTNAPAPFQTGIFEVSFAPYCNPQGCQVSAVWAVLVNGERTYVYAGGLGDDNAPTPVPMRGMVLVIVESIIHQNSSLVTYEAPGARGILHIVSDGGYRLKLIDEGGKQFFFDVLTRQFVKSMNATVTAATITPLPPRPTATASLTLPAYLAPETVTPGIYPMPQPRLPIP